MCRRLLIAALVVIGVAVAVSNATWARKQQAKEVKAATSADYVDMGIKLVVVERDPNGKPIVPGNSQKMRVVRELDQVGGIVKIWTDADGNRRAHVVRKSTNPVVWYASEAQADLITHDGPIPSVLVQGSEGSSKTTTLVMWTAWRVVDNIGRDCEGGLTAPTGPRLVNVLKELRRWWRPSWYHYSTRDKLFRFHALPRVQLVSAIQRSEEEGSPLQGANWMFCGSDEFQDHFGRNDDIMARGRTAEAAGVDYRRLCTSTFKDSPDWRTFRAVAEKASIPVNDNEPDGAQRPLWHLVKLLGLESPFIPPSHWQKMRAGLTDREYRRRVLAEDVGPERQVYYTWSRENLRPIPAVGARDVTREELAPWAKNANVLVGHDPGRKHDVSVFLKAFRITGVAEPVWYVVDEVTTTEQNYEDHVDAVVARLRSHWGCQLLDRKGNPDPESAKALVRADPYTNNGSDDERPDLTAYKVWLARGVDIRPAAFKPGTNVRMPVPKEARIDMVCTLLNGGQGRRLMVACNSRGEPLAPKTVYSFETMERDAANRAEREGKGTDGDASHWTSAVGWGLWSIEKPRLERLRKRAA